jgi:hypothetical protein
MRRAIGALVLSACAVAQAAEPPSVAIVSQLYRDFAWEAVLAPPAAPGLAQQPKSVLLRYFTPQLASALAADAACASQHHEVCALDFLPLWGSQDPVAQDLSFVQTSNDQVQVRFISPPSRQAVVLEFKTVPTKIGWRVADISYSSGPSLAQLLADNRK